MREGTDILVSPMFIRDAADNHPRASTTRIGSDGPIGILSGEFGQPPIQHRAAILEQQQVLVAQDHQRRAGAIEQLVETGVGIGLRRTRIVDAEIFANVRREALGFERLPHLRILDRIGDQRADRIAEAFHEGGSRVGENVPLHTAPQPRRQCQS